MYHIKYKTVRVLDTSGTSHKKNWCIGLDQINKFCSSLLKG